MKELLISKNLVPLAKEKGFPQYGHELFDMYYDLHTPLVLYIDGTTNSYFFNIEAQNRIGVRPTQALLQTWLRDKHKIFVECYTTTKGKFLGKVRKFNKNGRLQSTRIMEFDTYEKALEAGLEKALKKI
jgi:hypothetical protein